MSLKERTINVDIMTKEYTKLKYKQGDSNQILIFKFYKNGAKLDLTGCVAGIFYEKPNNEILEKTGNINSNTVTTTITSGVLNTPGIVKTEIFLTKNDEVSISFTILIEVESSIDKNAAVQEKEEWDVIKDLLINGNNVSMIDDSLTAANKTWSSSKIDSQINVIKNDLQSIGKPTDEQVQNSINQAISNGLIDTSGLSINAKLSLLNIISKISYFNENISNDYNTLITEFSLCTITTNLINVTLDNDSLYATKGNSYTANLVLGGGYNLNSCTITMNGEDVTATVLVGNTITISNITGDIIITAVASKEEALYEWDLTKSTTDTKQSKTLIGANNTNITEAGLLFGTGGAVRVRAENVISTNITIEIDIANASCTTPSNNNHVCGIGVAKTSPYYTVSWRKTGYWQTFLYSSNTWGNQTTYTDANIISGKTIKMTIDTNSYLKVYLNNDLFLEFTDPIDVETNHSLHLGDASNPYKDMVISGIRIYEGVK